VTIEDDVAATLRSSGAAFAFVFGSVAAGTARPESDLDVAAWWPGSAPAPWEVRVPEGVDLLVLNDASLELAGRVALEGRVILDDDRRSRVEWQATTRRIYLDEEERQQRLDDVFLRSRGR
jgi:uncharacterized protein